MPLDWEHGELAEGLRCYRGGEFFEAHEHWESAWLHAAQPEKTFLQALIQVAVAMHHFERGNRIGAAALLERSLRRLEAYPAEFGGVEVEAMQRSVRAWVEALSEQDAPRLPVPVIR